MEKNELFDSDEEEKVEYNPNGSLGDTNLGESIDISPAARETEIMREGSPNGAVGGYGSSDEDIEEVKDPKEYNFDYDCPYPDIVNSESTFCVSNPVKIGHVTYTVTGEDKEGTFEGSRRYKDFFSLRQALVNRWPGVYVPPIPPKQSVGNKKDKFVAYRMHFLDLFMKKIGTLPHFLNSDEFQKFSKPSGDISATLNALGQISPQDLKERMENELDVSPGIEEALFKKSREEVNEFQSFLKKIITTLKTIREQAEKMVNVKDNVNKRTAAIVDSMSYYESNGMTKFANQDSTKMIIENPEDTEMKNKAEGMGHSLSNTFKDFYFWIRSTLGDVEAALDAVNGKERIVQNKIKLENKKKSEQSELDSLSSGKTTFKSLFKSAAKKQNRIVYLNADIEKLEKEIEEYDIIVKMLNYHIAQSIIPEFKENQVKEYYKFLNFIARREINNSAATICFWNDFNKNENIPIDV